MYKIGDIVKHYKGNYYQIIGFATHTETLEELIIYRPYNIVDDIAGTKFWARPKNMFDESVNGVKRFTLVEEI